VRPRKTSQRLADRSRDFAVTLADGRRVVGRLLDSTWFVYVYASNDRNGRLLGYGTALTCPLALQRAGLSGDDADGTLGRAGI
jgi:hypothetical protein